jgi:AcrR family transcriptional regulator
MVKKSTPQKTKRRSPITRAEGEQRLINAAIQLVREKPFSEVGVRDIAVVADVNHGFVHTWFGSKNDLLVAATRQLVEQGASGVADVPAGQQAINPFDPDIQLAVRLAIWLDLEGTNSRNLLKEMPIITALTQRYIDIEGLSPEIARTAAAQAVAIGLGVVVFAPLIDLNGPEQVSDVFTLWRHNLGLLAKYPPA